MNYIYIYEGIGGDVYTANRKFIRLGTASQKELKFLFDKNYTGVKKVEDKQKPKKECTKH